MVPALVKLVARLTWLGRVALFEEIVTSWPDGTPGLGQVPVRVADPLLPPARANCPGPELRSSSRVPPSVMTTGFPDSAPARCVKRLLLSLKVPLLTTEPPRLVKAPPLEITKLTPVST